MFIWDLQLSNTDTPSNDTFDRYSLIRADGKFVVWPGRSAHLCSVTSVISRNRIWRGGGFFLKKYWFSRMTGIDPKLHHAG